MITKTATGIKLPGFREIKIKIKKNCSNPG